MTVSTLNMNQFHVPAVNRRELNLTPLKVTALSYLREARSREEYEQMAELIRYAREFGATEREVALILRGTF